MTADRVRQAWEKAREDAGFVISKGWHADLRFKDLRHTAAVAFEQVGMGTTKIGAGLGHRRRETSLKYTKREVQLDAAAAIKVASHLGILHDLPRRSSQDQQ